MNFSKFGVIDIEANDLLAGMLDYTSFPYKLKKEARLWCVVITNIGTGEVKKAALTEISKEWVEKALAEFDYIVAHNGIKYDFPVLKLFGLMDYRIGYPGQKDTLFEREVTFVDSLIISRLLNPDRYGGHSLEAWGERVGVSKIDFRAQCIEAGVIDKNAAKGAEFKQYVPFMLDYCEGDTKTNGTVLVELLSEMVKFKGWTKALKMENKLADLAVRRETLGFFFDKELAVRCLADLTEKMQGASDKVLPVLPPKKMNKGELKEFTPPKTQLIAKGGLAKHMLNFAERIGATFDEYDGKYSIVYEDIGYELPYYEPLKTHQDPSMKDLDHIKMYLIKLGWVPTEWRERDLTKDSKKQSISYEKRIKALQKWFDETMEGKYKNERLEIIDIPAHHIMEVLSEKLKGDWPVRVPTSPCVRVGVEKELCPNLEKLGDKVAFARDFALYLTYKHRKSSIAGGDIEDMDFDLEYPNTGFLSNYREVDGRIPTPAIEIGASTSRYRHISVCNIARAESVYGKEMRSLFGCGHGAMQLGYDWSSLENRIQGHYIWKYPGGPELSKTLIAEKPNDLHTVNSIKLGISRTDCKSVNYMLLYGGQIPKVMKMLGVSKEKATEIFNGFWNAVEPLKLLKEALEKHWENNDKKFILGIDGRQIRTRSKHSLLNALFQSGGVIFAKYVTVYLMQYLEEKGYCIDPFEGQPDICSMIEYHDEGQLYASPKLFSFKTFESEEEGNKFIEEWEGGKLSTLSHDKKWYVVLPNDISSAIEFGMKRTEKELSINVPMAFEFSVHKNWYGCH